MTRRDPRPGDADKLDRQVDEALALANEKATAERASPPPDVPDPELGWPPPSVARTIRHGGTEDRRAPADEPDDALGWPPPSIRPVPPDREPPYTGGGGSAGAGILDTDVDVWSRGVPDDSTPGRAPGARPDGPAHDTTPAPHETASEAPLTSWPDARRIAARAPARAVAKAAPVLRALDDALGHVLAEPLTALTDLPPFDTSAMDGWALAGPGPS